MFNNTYNYFFINVPDKSYYDTSINNDRKSPECLGKTQSNILNIYSTNINCINILDFSSLNDVNFNSPNFNSPYRVKGKKSSKSLNKNVITLNSRKKILILDLDETLVHSSTKNPFPNKKNLILDIKDIKYKIYVIIRPFLEKFLQEMSLYYDLYIYTASIPQYSKTLVKILDKKKVIIQVLHRDHCLNIYGKRLKDLTIFNKDLKDIIIIDNNPAFYVLNKENGIPIQTWIGEPKDKELLKLIPILKYLSKVKDVRPIIKEILNKTKDKIDFSKVNEILQKNNNLKHISKHNNIKNKYDFINFYNLNKSMGIIKKENNSIKRRFIKVNKTENITKNNSDFNKSNINKLNIIKKFRTNKTKPHINNNNLENIRSVNNKTNMFKTIDINEDQKESFNINKSTKLYKNLINKKDNITNISAVLNKHKINEKNLFRKKFEHQKYKIIKKRINLNKFENKNDKNKTFEKKENYKYPHDNVKTNIKNYLNFSKRKESELKNLQTEKENRNNKINFMSTTGRNKENSHLSSITKIDIAFNYTQKINEREQLSRLNEDIQPIKKNKIVIMKILKNPNEN